MSKLSKTAYEVICEEGARVFPNEACGLIVKVGRKSVAVPCENSHEQPAGHFRISPVEYARCASMGEVIAAWHTHVNESSDASEADRVECEGSEMPWYIVAVCKSHEGLSFSEPNCIIPCGYEADYVGRPYVFGIHDCHTLVCDYYQREFDIEIRRDRPRIPEWWNKGHNFFSSSYFKEDGFVELFGEEPMVGDVFVIQMGAPIPNHLAIYLGDDKILHHSHNRLSTRDIYGGHWLKHTVHHLRHKSKC